MQDTGVGACCDDGGVGGELRAVLSEFVQQFCFQMVFAHILSSAQHAGAGLHGADVGLRADLCRATHGVLFMCVFD